MTSPPPRSPLLAFQSQTTLALTIRHLPSDRWLTFTVPQEWRISQLKHVALEAFGGTGAGREGESKGGRDEGEMRGRGRRREKSRTSERVGRITNASMKNEQVMQEEEKSPGKVGAKLGEKVKKLASKLAAPLPVLSHNKPARLSLPLLKSSPKQPSASPCSSPDSSLHSVTSRTSDAPLNRSSASLSRFAAHIPSLLSKVKTSPSSSFSISSSGSVRRPSLSFSASSVDDARSVGSSAGGNSPETEKARASWPPAPESIGSPAPSSPEGDKPLLGGVAEVKRSKSITEKKVVREKIRLRRPSTSSKAKEAGTQDNEKDKKRKVDEGNWVLVNAVLGNFSSDHSIVGAKLVDHDLLILKPLELSSLSSAIVDLTHQDPRPEEPLSRNLDDGRAREEEMVERVVEIGVDDGTWRSAKGMTERKEGEGLIMVLRVYKDNALEQLFALPPSAVERFVSLPDNSTDSLPPAPPPFFFPRPLEPLFTNLSSRVPLVAISFEEGEKLVLRPHRMADFERLMGLVEETDDTGEEADTQEMSRRKTIIDRAYASRHHLPLPAAPLPSPLAESSSAFPPHLAHPAPSRPPTKAGGVPPVPTVVVPRSKSTAAVGDAVSPTTPRPPFYRSLGLSSPSLASKFPSGSSASSSRSQSPGYSFSRSCVRIPLARSVQPLSPLPSTSNLPSPSSVSPSPSTPSPSPGSSESALEMPPLRRPPPPPPHRPSRTSLRREATPRPPALNLVPNLPRSSAYFMKSKSHRRAQLDDPESDRHVRSHSHGRKKHLVPPFGSPSSSTGAAENENGSNSSSSDSGVGKKGTSPSVDSAGSLSPGGQSLFGGPSSAGSGSAGSPSTGGRTITPRSGPRSPSSLSSGRPTLTARPSGEASVASPGSLSVRRRDFAPLSFAIELQIASGAEAGGWGGGGGRGALPTGLSKAKSSLNLVQGGVGGKVQGRAERNSKGERTRESAAAAEGGSSEEQSSGEGKGERNVAPAARWEAGRAEREEQEGREAGETVEQGNRRRAIRFMVPDKVVMKRKSAGRLRTMR
ncbi:hypothetical protein JCM8547_008780 [Rhodosporidiobolus lusitaniae]